MLLRVLHRDAFRELDFELVWRDVELVRDRDDALGEVRPLQLLRGDVDRHRHRFEARALPRCDLPRDIADDAFAELDDEVGSFGDLDELQRRHGAVARIVPARERLEADQAAAADVDDRLQLDFDGLAVHGAAQVLFERETRMHALVHRGVEHLHVVAAARLRFVQRDVRAAQQLAHRRRVTRVDREPDAGGRRVGGFAEPHGLLECRRDALGDGRAVGVEAVVTRDDQELVAAHAHDQVRTRDRIAQPARDRTKVVVADRVTA